MPPKENDQLFVEEIIKQIVNNPDKVVVNRTVDEMGVLLSVQVDAPDMGLLIGRSGSTAKAIRTLVRIVGMRNESRVNMKIEEPEGGRISKDPQVGTDQPETAPKPATKELDEIQKDL